MFIFHHFNYTCQSRPTLLRRFLTWAHFVISSMASTFSCPILSGQLLHSTCKSIIGLLAAPLCCCQDACKLMLGHRGPHNVVTELFHDVLSRMLFTLVWTAALGTAVNNIHSKHITQSVCTTKWSSTKVLKQILVCVSYIVHWIPRYQLLNTSVQP